MKYRYILWDSDDTLLDFQAAERYSFQKTMSEAGLPVDEESHGLYSRINDDLWMQLNAGQVTKEFLVVERFRKYLEILGAKADPAALNQEYLNNLSDCSALVKGAYEIVNKLEEMGMRQYIITNAVSFVAKKRIGNSSLAPFMRDIFVSEAIGCGKPDKAYYNYVFSHIPDFNPTAALAVGDSLTSDIQGGINAGIDTCYFNPKGKSAVDVVKSTYEIRDLAELLKIISD